MTILAIDQGTTSTRALAVDGDDARIVHAVRHRQHYPAPGWVEHDAEELIDSLRQCLVAAGDIEAIGIDNQGESCLAWDADSGEALCKVIVWQDNRTGDVIEQLKADGAGELVMSRCGLPLDSYFSASKLAWILRNVPAADRLLQRGRLRLGTTDAFFLDRLAGRFVTDVTTASRTSLMNLETLQWDPELCRLFGVPIEALPEIVPTTGHLGDIDTAFGRVPVTASVVDQQAALYGHGCRHSGDAKITFGTGAFVLALTGERIVRAPRQGLLPTVAWQAAGSNAVYALDGGVYSAGSAIEWARGLGLFADYESINRFSGDPAILRGLAFVPALSGLACPHWDRSAAGLWIGMSLDTTAEDLARAVVEGVALRAAEVIRAMDDHVAIGARISVDGGVSVNPYFCQFLADALDRTVVVQSFAELTAVGTAGLAGATLRPAAEADASTYEPRRDLAGAREMYDDAVKRAGHWRR